jgi:hypothetical protein
VFTFFLHRKVLAASLRIGFVCGLASVLLDIDHIPKTLGLMAEGRPLHIPIFIIALAGCAYFGRLLARNILKNLGE